MIGSLAKRDCPKLIFKISSSSPIIETDGRFDAGRLFGCEENDQSSRERRVSIGTEENHGDNQVGPVKYIRMTMQVPIETRCFKSKLMHLNSSLVEINLDSSCRKSRACKKPSQQRAMKFFRIILHPISRKSQLDLPRTFLARYMEESNSPSSVTLKVPDGRKWRVELKRKHDKVWLRHGWPEFAMCLELQPGSFLVFDYQEKECVFLVEVFDSTTCEINYATAGDDEDVWLVETTAAVHELSLKRPTVEEMLDEEDDDEDVWLVETEGNAPTRPRKSNTNRAFSLGRRQLVNERPLQLTVKPWRLERASVETKRAFQRAQSLKIQGPYVIVLMHKTYVKTSRNELRLPAKFITTYFNLANNNIMMKVDEKGTSTTWSSVYSVRKPYRAARVSGGWKKLAIHKKLQVGDICVFELLERLENSLKVHIFRASKRR